MALDEKQRKTIHFGDPSSRTMPILLSVALGYASALAFLGAPGTAATRRGWVQPIWPFTVYPASCRYLRTCFSDSGCLLEAAVLSLAQRIHEQKVSRLETRQSDGPERKNQTGKRPATAEAWILSKWKPLGQPSILMVP